MHFLDFIFTNRQIDSKMAQKSPYTLPQNGHFWGGLFYSLFCSNRSKWDSNCNCYFRPLLEKTFSRGLRYDRMALLQIMLRLSHFSPLADLYFLARLPVLLCVRVLQKQVSPFHSVIPKVLSAAHSIQKILTRTDKEGKRGTCLTERDTVVTDYQSGLSLTWQVFRSNITF